MLEDLDAIAGTVAFAHAHEVINSTHDKVTLVTACVDRIDLRRRLDPAHDCDITGVCTWTGARSPASVSRGCRRGQSGRAVFA
jgi:hypothetical protein